MKTVTPKPGRGWAWMWPNGSVSCWAWSAKGGLMLIEHYNDPKNVAVIVPVVIVPLTLWRKMTRRKARKR